MDEGRAVENKIDNKNKEIKVKNKKKKESEHLTYNLSDLIDKVYPQFRQPSKKKEEDK